MLRLRGSFAGNARLNPLLDRTLSPKDFDITWEIGSNPGTMFAKQLRENAADVFEFSISDYINVRDHANDRWDWIAIPVFLTKALLQLNTWTRVGSGIESAADLKSKRLAVGDYTMTAFVWFRAMVDRLYGIKPEDIHWYNQRIGGESHSVLLGLTNERPPGVSLTFLDRWDAGSEMLRAGELDAACATGVDFDLNASHVRRLFPDRGRAFLADFYGAAGFCPVNHTVVLKRQVAEENPWLPAALYEAFEAAKKDALRRDPEARRILRDGGDPQWEASVFGHDPYPSGLAANRGMLEMLVAQVHRDGLISKPVGDVSQLFHESVRGT
jgi:4,5-dihydroxyphthalate decarboxylase